LDFVSFSLIGTARMEGMAVVDEVDGTMVEPMANSSSSLEEVLGGIGCVEELALYHVKRMDEYACLPGQQRPPLLHYMEASRYRDH